MKRNLILIFICIVHLLFLFILQMNNRNAEMGQWHVIQYRQDIFSPTGDLVKVNHVSYQFQLPSDQTLTQDHPGEQVMHMMKLYYEPPQDDSFGYQEFSGKQNHITQYSI